MYVAISLGYLFVLSLLSCFSLFFHSHYAVSPSLSQRERACRPMTVAGVLGEHKRLPESLLMVLVDTRFLSASAPALKV